MYLSLPHVFDFLRELLHFLRLIAPYWRSVQREKGTWPWYKALVLSYNAVRGRGTIPQAGSVQNRKRTKDKTAQELS